MERKVKLTYICPNLELNGAQAVVVRLLTHIDFSRFDVSLVIFEQKDNYLERLLFENKIQVFCRTSRKENFILRQIRRLSYLRKVILKLDPDVIHAHLDYRFIWILALFYQKRFIETIHSQPYRIKTRWITFMYKQLSKKGLIRPIFLTKSNVIEFAELFNVPWEELDIIPNPIDVKKYYYEEKERILDPDGTIRFTFTARFHPIKNHHMLITAFNEALKVVPNIKLQLAGTGECMRNEKKYVEALGITKKVDFLGEITDIPLLLRKSDVCVISSDSESFSLALTEAMAAGLPIIATSVGGIRDIMDGNGILVPANDAMEFAKAMICMAKSEELRTKFGNRSRELVQKYDIHQVMRQYEELYMEEYQKSINR